MRLAIRGSQGLHMVDGPPDFEEDETFPPEKSSKCKVWNRITNWNNCGSMFVFLNPPYQIPKPCPYLMYNF